MNKPLVYIASPYTKGDPCINTHFQCKVFDEMLNDGVVIPYMPLWLHFQHTLFPRPYQDWIKYDNTLIPKMDAMLRLNADIIELNYFQSESSGADNEVLLAQSLNIPVFYNKQNLYDWVGC